MMPGAKTAPDASWVGSTLSGRYVLSSVLGWGAIGTVFATTRPSDGLPVALKRLRSAHAHDPELRARFLEEGRTMQRLVHPNIVPVFEVGEDASGVPYFVMERLEGVSLRELIHQRVQFTILQSASIAMEILSALACAHAAQIVHRDLKPENVMLVREPSGAFSVRVLDFGIAKVLSSSTPHTRPGQTLGTPAYMSPEQIRSPHDVDARTDIWSVGALVYELATGRPPFPGPTEIDRMKQVVSTEPVPLAHENPELAPLAGVVHTALRKDRSERFASADAMMSALGVAFGTLPKLTELPSARATNSIVQYNQLATLASSPGVSSGGQTLVTGASTQPASAPPSRGPTGTLASRRSGSTANFARPVSVSVADPTREHSPRQLPARRAPSSWVLLAVLVVAVVFGLSVGVLLVRLGR